jgi:hypothetical protein
MPVLQAQSHSALPQIGGADYRLVILCLHAETGLCSNQSTHVAVDYQLKKTGN